MRAGRSEEIVTEGPRPLKAFLTLLAGLVCIVVHSAAAALLLLLLLWSNPSLLLPVVNTLLLPQGITLAAGEISLGFGPPTLSAAGLELSTSDGVHLSASRVEARSLTDLESGALGALARPVAVRVEGLRVTRSGEEPLTLYAAEGSGMADPRMFRTGGRVLSSIELNGPEMELVLKESQDADPFDPRTIPGFILDLLPAESLTVRDGRVDVRLGTWQASAMEVELALSATAERWNGHVRAHLFVEPPGQARSGALVIVTADGTAAGLAGEVELIQGSLSVTGGKGESSWECAVPVEARVGMALDPNGLTLRDGALRSPAVSLTFPRKGLMVELPLLLRAVGAARSTEVELEVGTLLELAGTVNVLWGEEPSVDLAGRVREASAMLELLRPLLPDEIAGLSLKGEVPLRLTHAQGTVLRLLPERVVVEHQELGVRGLLSGSLQVSDLESRPRLDGKIGVAGASLLHEGLALSRGAVEAEISGLLEAPSLPWFQLIVPEGGIELDGTTLPLGRVTARGRADVGPVVHLSEVTLGSETLGQVTFSATVDKGAVTGRFEAPALPLEGLVAALPDPQTREPVMEWGLEGALSLSGSFSAGRGEAALSIDGTLSGAGLASPEGAILAHEGGGRFTLEIRGNGQARMDLSLDRGELLVETVYLDLRDGPLLLTGSGVVEGRSKLSDLSVRGGIAPYFEGAFREGVIAREGEGWSYSGLLTLQEMDLGSIYATFLRDPLSSARPSLQQLEVAGMGEAEIGLSGRPGRLELRGGVRLAGASLRDGAGSLLVEGLDLDLPLAYLFGGSADIAPGTGGPPAMGSLSIGSVHTPAGSLAGLTLPVALVPNRLVVQGELFLPLLDGGLRIGWLEVEEPLSAGFSARTRAFLERIDLSRVQGSTRLEGSIGGDLGLVTMDRTGVRAEGSLSGSIFGGDLRVEDLVVMDPLGLARAYGADVSVRLMDLSEFSRAFGFGSVSGRMDFDLNDLRIAYGQPVGFRLRAESVPARGVDQKVSLAAVNAISVVGTGASLTSTAATIFGPFVQEFAYREIGIACELTNDVFRVNGLIREGGVEYLVRKPPLFGINVINRNPDNRISFKDMLERINRVLPDEDKPT
jgi:hypothetical protein